MTHDFGSDGARYGVVARHWQCAGGIRQVRFSLNAVSGTQLTILQNGNPNPVLHITLTIATRRHEVTQLGPIVHPPGFGENDVAFVD